MATLNQVIRERKLKFRNLKRVLRAADSELEKAERLLNRVLRRKSKVPEVEDLVQLVKFLRTLQNLVNQVISEAGDGFPV